MPVTYNSVMNVTVPAVDAQLQAFLSILAQQTSQNGLVPDLAPQLVPHTPYFEFEEGNCWYNAWALTVCCKPSKDIHGWVIWQHGDKLIAQHHAVFSNANGLFDVTQCEYLNGVAIPQILFVEDDRFRSQLNAFSVPYNLEIDQSTGSVVWFYLDNKKWVKAQNFGFTIPEPDDAEQIGGFCRNLLTYCLDAQLQCP